MLPSEDESNEDEYTSSESGSGHLNSEWDKLNILLWKNIRVLWSNWVHCVIGVAVPLFFCSVLVLLRIAFITNIQPVENYPILELNDYWKELMTLIDKRREIVSANSLRNISNPFIPEKIVGYAPNMLGYTNIMNGAGDYLSSLVVKNYSTCDDLRSAIITENLFAGVCFILQKNKVLEKNREIDELFGDVYPKNLKYHLIFPFACRIYHDTFIGISWSTNSLYHYINRTQQRNVGQIDGGYVGYIREGFAPLQNAISTSFIKLVAALKVPNFQMPKIVMRRLPSKEYQEDDLLRSIDFSMSLMIMLGAFYPALMIMHRIVGEKERILKSFSKIMGISNYVHCLGWMCTYLLVALLISFMIVMILKIKWSSGTAILDRSNFFALLFVMYVYNITSVCFILMAASFFTQSTFALSEAAVAWFLTYVPYIMSLIEYHGGSLNLTIFRALFHNTVLGFIIEAILELEVFGNGLNFGNIFETRCLRWHTSLGSLSCIMLSQCLIYLCISLYIEEIIPNNTGSAKPWNYLFTFKGSTILTSQGHVYYPTTASNKRGGSIQKRIRTTSFIYEVGRAESEDVVVLHNVFKSYKHEFVLKNINLHLSDNEITVLLGHNGSGKSTLLSMISGLSSITAGTININGFDVTTEARYACASIGLCMDNALLHRDLTVEDQLRYFGYLKGLGKDSVELELDHYLKAAKLTQHSLKKTKYLSMGELQKLAVCCALVGHSRVVLLDCPVTYMSLASRTLIWKLLQNEKHNRTILITSTSADILHGVGDRIVILNNGEVQCDGTPEFIKKMYGRGYRLVVKGPEINLTEVTQKLREYLPNVIPISTLGNEVCYDFQEGDSNIVDQLTDSVERSLISLGIESVTLRPINIDDIFFKLAAANPSRENRTRLIEIMNGESSYPEESKHLRFMEIKERVTGIRKTLQHCQAMWSQRWAFAAYFKYHDMRRLVCSPLFVVLAFFVSSFRINNQPMPVIEFSLTQYDSSHTLIEQRNIDNVPANIIDRYMELVFWHGVQHRIETTEGKLLSEHFLNDKTNAAKHLIRDYQVAVTFGVDYIIAWFSNLALHTVPLSLNMVHNAILRTILGEEGGINILFEPLNNQQNYIDSQIRMTSGTSHILPLCIAMCVSCIWNTIVFIFVREIRSGYHKAQLVAGAKFLTYWLVNVTYDFIIVVLSSILITLAIRVCQYQLHIEWYIYSWYTFIFMLYGWYVYAFNYMIALFLASPSHTFALSLSIQAFSVLCFCHMIEAFENDYVTTAKGPYALYFMIMPMFSFCSAIATIYYNGEFNRICSDENIRFVSIYLEHCEATPNCCRTLSGFSLMDGVIIEVMVIIASTCICWWVILMDHYREFCTCTNIPEDDYYAQFNDHQRRHDDTKEYALSEVSAFTEQMDIQRQKNAQLRTIPLLCDRLGKNFGNKVAVDRLSLVLERSNCFCFLGVSGSGVTTLFNIITGFQTHSYGRILIKGRNAIYNSKLLRRLVGYGRQQMIRFPELTVKSVMEHACKLRNYPQHYVEEICINLAKVLGIFPYYHKRLCHLSSGTLNRLNCAVTFMGNPEIILLDMATAYIDSAGKREIWNVLKRMQSAGSCILVSTGSLRDCERYCNRVGFMSRGRLCLIGTPWSLKEPFADYHYLKVKTIIFKLPTMRSSHYMHFECENKLTDFVYKNFPNAILKEQRGNTFIFHLPVYCNSITYIFKALLSHAYYLNIEDFELNHSSLSESFLAFWQREQSYDDTDTRATIYVPRQKFY